MPDLDDIRATLARIPNPIRVLESLFALAPVGLQIYEAGGRSLLVNQAFLDMFGTEPPPGYNVLEDEGRTLLLVNAQHIKNVPGRKTDLKDAEWLADLLRHGLLQASFIPPAPIRELRELTR